MLFCAMSPPGRCQARWIIGPAGIELTPSSKSDLRYKRMWAIVIINNLRRITVWFDINCIETKSFVLVFLVCVCPVENSMTLQIIGNH